MIESYEVIAGVRFDAYNLEGLMRSSVKWIKEKAFCRQVIFANAFSTVLFRNNPEYARACVTSDIVVADGTSISLVSNIIGQRSISRIPGPDFMHEMLKKGARLGLRHYFLGCSTNAHLEHLLSTVRRLDKDYSVFAEGYCPPFGEWSDELNDEIIRRIHTFEPDVLWVGVGGPKQDLWIAKYKDRLPPCMAMGVGAAFDFESGYIKRAPFWIRKMGFEWLHRLLSNPKRLWKRYLLGNFEFLFHVLRCNVIARDQSVTYHIKPQ